ncbi:helix-turn-helix domain-containing protein [Micromonospora marina]|uniref:Divergent AAA domain n=1 Tax=Micromonospora marina TaxID=307120 RepID=A0A1C4V545_9ACTN|nr:RNA-binding domain-containing protein [Micromonospora marina]SCE79067.1 Divergent AAA domain [Micromonospora marina]
MDPVPAADGRVDRERLDELLALQTEFDGLDFKQERSLAKGTKARLEFVKDCAAMLSRPHGGYLVIGVDGVGAPSGAVIETADYDASRLHDMLTKHLEGQVSVSSGVHTVDGSTVVLVCLRRRDDGLFPVVKADFVANDGGTPTIVLRGGDVYVREGTKTRKWRSADLVGLIAPHVAMVRQEERARLADLMDVLRREYQGLALASGPVAALTWQVGQEQFDAAVTEAIRRNDTSALRLLVLGLQRDGLGLLTQDATAAGEDLLQLLDRATAVAAIAVTLSNQQLVDDVVTMLARLYHRLYVNGEALTNTAAERGLAIAARILAVIALAVRLDQWWVIRKLALRPAGDTIVYVSWLRHAQVQAARRHVVLTNTATEPVGGGLVAAARQLISTLPTLRPDLPGDLVDDLPLGTPPAPGDPVIDSVCQADLLWCVAAALDTPQERARYEFYPSFAWLYEHRIAPMVNRLRTDENLTRDVYPGRAVDEVRDALDEVLQLSAREGGRLGHFR